MYEKLRLRVQSRSDAWRLKEDQMGLFSVSFSFSLSFFVEEDPTYYPPRTKGTQSIIFVEESPMHYLPSSCRRRPDVLSTENVLSTEISEFNSIPEGCGFAYSNSIIKSWCFVWSPEAAHSASTRDE